MASRFNDDVHDLSDSVVDQFHKANFVAGNVVVAGTGVKHEDLVRWSELHLKSLPTAAPTPVVNTPYLGGYLQSRRNLGGKTYLSLAFPQPADTKAYCVLRNVLRNKLSESAATAGVTVFSSPRSDGGVWGFIFGGETGDAVHKLHAAINILKQVNAAGNIDGAKNAVRLLRIQLFMISLFLMMFSFPVSVDLIGTSLCRQSRSSCSCAWGC